MTIGSATGMVATGGVSMPFYTDSQGRKRPLDGKGDGGKGKVGAGVVAVVIAGALALASGGGVTSVGAGGSSSVSTRAADGKQAARRGDTDGAWRRMRARDVRRHVEHATECAAHSYGEVREFFVRTPCLELRRALFAMTDDAGNGIVVSVSWVRMRSAADARALRSLADTDGTGNVTPIGMAALRLADVPFTGRFHDSRRDDRLVVIAEAEPVSGTPDPAVLDGLAAVAAELPPL